MAAATETGTESAIFRIFEQMAAKDPDAVAVYENGKPLTRGELVDRTFETAAILRNHGIESGETIAVQMRNSSSLLTTIAAALHLRTPILPIDRDARQNESHSILEQFSARALIRTDDTGEITVELSSRSTAKSNGSDTALIKLTSGSTGRPRGVLTTEENLIADCRNICETMGITPDDINLGAIPFSHSYGFSNLVTPLLLQGTRIVVSNDYMPVPLLELCNEYEVSFLPGIPMMYDHLSRMPYEDGRFETVRRFISAGAPLPPTVARAFRERHGSEIQTFYGCSECGGIAFDRTGGAAERGTVGEPMENVEIRIDAERRLVITGAAVARGYTNATAEEASRFSRDAFKADDLAELTPAGEIRITGRSSALINIAGKKVNPREVEIAIQSIEGVRQVAVVGSPAGARGELVMAVVVADAGVTRQLIRQRCQQILSAHKVPRVIKLVDEIPVDERGKIRKSSLV